jgi:hypothetical protein
MLPNLPLHPPFLGPPPGTPQGTRRTHPLQMEAPETSLPVRSSVTAKAKEERKVVSMHHLKKKTC